MRTLIAAAFVCASAALVTPALAQDSTSDSMSPWFVRAGAAELQNMDGLKLTVGGRIYLKAILIARTCHNPKRPA